eukprot:gene3552-2315_t
MRASRGRHMGWGGRRPPGGDDIRFESLREVRLLGRGASGNVNLVEDASTGRRYAVKTIHFP